MNTIKVANFSTLGINFAEVQSCLGPIFDTLPWDEYDVRVQQLKALEIDDPTIFAGDLGKQLYAEYFSGQKSIDYCIPAKPFRRRAAGLAVIIRTDSGFDITPMRLGDYNQDSNDYRSLKRTFQNLPAEIYSARWFQELLVQGILLMEQTLQTKADRVLADIHFMRLVVEPGEPRTNTPEGKHHDGVDFLMTCLTHLQNATGANSFVWNDDEELILNHRLIPGEILIMPDFLHEVSNMESADGINPAVRDIVGIDFTIT